VQDVVLAKWRTRESMSLVLISINLPLGTINRFVQSPIGWSAENIQKWFLIYVECPPCGIMLGALRKQPQVQCLCIVKLVSRSTLEIVPWETCQEDYSLHPQLEKGFCYYEKDQRVQNMHLNVWSKEKEEHKIYPKFCGTTPVIFNSTVSDSNEVGLTPNLVTSFLA
jgi:hypothetical protein